MFVTGGVLNNIIENERTFLLRTLNDEILNSTLTRARYARDVSEESGTLRGRESMRLSCVTCVWGDTVVYLNGDVRRDQWTR